MPAIVDPDGPDGKEISIFESGAILQYLGRKTGLFYPSNYRKQLESISGSSGKLVALAQWEGKLIISEIILKTNFNMQLIDIQMK